MDNPDKKHYQDIEALAREAGEIMLSAQLSRGDIDAKEGHANLVTRYDSMVQERLRGGLAKILPGSGFYGEEGAHSAFPDDEYTFIVDPIDGTSNFIHDFALSAIAIALVKRDLSLPTGHGCIYGLVYNPFTDELFSAMRGEGASLNGRPIHVSGAPLSESLVMFGTAPYYEGCSALAFDRAAKLLPQCVDVRRLGSAELDLCYVACGRAGMYFEPLIQPWDLAAGSIIVEEAGGYVTRWDGSPVDLTAAGSCLARSHSIHIDTL